VALATPSTASILPLLLSSSLNIGMDRRIAQDKIIGFALGLGKHD
jgi:hypothetical protein